MQEHDKRSLAKAPPRTIKDWPASERPRERLLAHGPQALSDAELLAIFLRIGLPGASAIDLARDALRTFGGLNGLLSASLERFTAQPGFGPAKYAQFQAILELARRSMAETVRNETLLDSPPKVRDFLRLSIGRLPHEVFFGLFLDAQNRLICEEQLSHGTLTQTSVYPREVVKRALAHNAAAVIFAHNHPSGLAEPSHADQALTQALQRALALVDIRVLDHLVITHSAHVSFAERGLL